MAFSARMERGHRPRSGVTLGGVGTGGMELRHDGVFYNWSIFNNYPLGLGAPFTMAHDSVLFFVVRFREAGGEPKMRLLQIEPEYGAAGLIDHPHYYVFPWLSGVDETTYEGVFPRVRMRFRDRAMPCDVELEAWSAFIPHDVKNSCLPAVFFEFTVIPRTRRRLEVMLMASMRNAVAYDIPERTYVSRVVRGKGYLGFEMTCDGVDPAHASMGTMGVISFAPESTYYLGWEHRHPYYEIALRQARLPNIDDTEGRNVMDEERGRRVAMERCFSTVAYSRTLRGERDRLQHSFAAVWHFPNRYAESVNRGRHHARPEPAEHIEGHYYSNFFASAAEVAAYVAAQRCMLRRRTMAFVDAFYRSSVDRVVLDQINSHLNTFVTSSWVTKSGDFGVLEGIDPHHSYAGLATMDVAMYGGVSAATLFPELDRAMLRAHRRFQSERGTVAHSITRNFKEIQARELEGKRIDMPAQYAYMVVRAGLWAEDLAFLREMWPSVKSALDYVLRERDGDGDCLPDMEGIMCSYDNFPMYGASSYVGGQFLAAVAAAVEAARLLGDEEAATRYGSVLARGARAFEEKLWNGQYYRLYNDEAGTHGKDEGCLADQLLGQWAAHLCGLSLPLDPRRVKRALRYIMKQNYHPEYGLRNCRWPGDSFLHEVDKDTWVDQANTVWSGVELAFASLLLYEGMWRDALRVIKQVDTRYRHWGMYFDHQEFGGHYYRAMSAWGIMNGLLGLAMKNGRYTFAPRVPGDEVRLFFSHARGTGLYSRQKERGKEVIRLEVVSGEFCAREVELGSRVAKVVQVELIAEQRARIPRRWRWEASAGMVRLFFSGGLQVREGGAVQIKVGRA
ncbi:MAG: GH116 family glycosyl hydrolase [bacterium]|nr:GH116 family glycosyl hydrolase [bacterium]